MDEDLPNDLRIENKYNEKVSHTVDLPHEQAYIFRRIVSSKALILLVENIMKFNETTEFNNNLANHHLSLKTDSLNFTIFSTRRKSPKIVAHAWPDFRQKIA